MYFYLPVGRSKLLLFVGLSFSLLCIIQTTINVSVWLQAGEYQPTPPTTSHHKMNTLIHNTERLPPEIDTIGNFQLLLMCVIIFKGTVHHKIRKKHISPLSC